MRKKNVHFTWVKSPNHSSNQRGPLILCQVVKSLARPFLGQLSRRLFIEILPRWLRSSPSGWSIASPVDGARMDTQQIGRGYCIRIPVHLLIQCGDCPGIEIREAEEIRAQIWIGARRQSEKNGPGTLQILEVHPVKSTWKCSSECFRSKGKLVHFGFPGKLELLLLSSYKALLGFSNAFSRSLAAVPHNVIAWVQGLHRWCTSDSVTLRT